MPDLLVESGISLKMDVISLILAKLKVVQRLDMTNTNTVRLKVVEGVL